MAKDRLDGNWAGHCGLNVSLNRGLKSYIAAVTTHSFHNNLFDATKFIPETNLHISLSKSFVLRFYQIEPFLNRLFALLPPVHLIRISLEVYCEYFVCYNETKTRKFLCIPVEDPTSALSKLTTVVIKYISSHLELILRIRRLMQHSQNFNNLHFFKNPNFTSGRPNSLILSHLFSHLTSLTSEFEPSVGSEMCDDQEDSSLGEDGLFSETIQVPPPTSSLETSTSASDEDSDEDSISVVLNLTGLSCRIGNKLFHHTSSGFREI